MGYWNEQTVLFFLTLVVRKINNSYSLNHDLLVGLLKWFPSLMVCVADCRLFFSRLPAILLFSVTQPWKRSGKTAVDSMFDQLNITNNMLFLQKALVFWMTQQTQTPSLRMFAEVDPHQFDMFTNINLQTNTTSSNQNLKPSPNVSQTKP